jgi:hypothetical protein
MVAEGRTHTNPMEFSPTDFGEGAAAAFGHKPEHMKGEA